MIAMVIVFALSFVVAMAALISGIVAATYGLWRLWEWLCPPVVRGRGFEVIFKDG
jgi:hypothetical protein